MIQKILKEPLFYFLLLGGGMFALFQQVSDEGFSSSDEKIEIVITDGQVDAFILGFEKVWQRVPNQQEFDALVQDFIREEILYREAMAMGLDRNDTIIRRRLRQKMEFLSEDIVSLSNPDDPELQAYLDKNQDSYLTQTRFSFQQIYFDVSERGDSAYSEAEALLPTLRDGSVYVLDDLGDQLMMTQTTYNNIFAREVQRVLGNQFLESLKTMPEGSWQGPVQSGFGLHLVYLDQFIEGVLPPLTDIRAEVLRDWTNFRQKEANDAFYAAMRETYSIIFESEEAQVTEE